MQGAPDGGAVTGELFDFLSVRAEIGLADAHRDPRVQLDLARVARARHFGHVGKDHGFAFRVDALARGVIEAEHDVLRRHDDRIPVRGRQNIIGREHKRSRFHLGFERQRNVHGHLVAVEVRVERGAHERV